MAKQGSTSRPSTSRQKVKAVRVSSAVAKSKTPTSINFVGSSLMNPDVDCDSSDESREGGFEATEAPIVVEYHKEEEDDESSPS